MPTPQPLRDLLARVPTLNKPDVPIVYEVSGDQLVARWDVVRAQSLYPTEFTSIDQTFSVTVTFDEGKGTYRSKDHEKMNNLKFGTGGVTFGSDSFSGKKVGRQFSFEVGGVHQKDGEGVSPTLAWSFDPARIKDPLFAFLESNGWKKHRGLFG